MRAFIALPVAPEVQARIGELILQLQRGTPLRSVRWSKPGQIHLTLRFLGDVPDAAANDIADAMRRAATGSGPLRLETAEVGLFGTPEHPRVVWIGVGGDSGPLHELQRRINEATTAYGEREDRAYHPHLTLGRVNRLPPRERTDFRETIRVTRLNPVAAWVADRVELIRSQLDPGGSRYTELASIPLATT